MLRITSKRSVKSSTPLGIDPTTADQELLDRLNGVTDQQVSKASQSVAPFSEDDDAHDKRATKAKDRQTFHAIRRAFYWFLFGLGCLATLILVGGFLLLIAIYLKHVIWGYKLADAGLLQQIIVGVLWTAVVAMATLWTEGALKDGDR